MADIELVIKIPEKEYNMILLSDKTVMANRVSKEAMMYAIKNSTPLPKDHGRLKDVDWIYNHTPSHWDDEDGSPCVTWEEIYDAPTIIKADKAESEVV